jgi:hypothetical protein
MTARNSFLCRFDTSKGESWQPLRISAERKYPFLLLLFLEDKLPGWRRWSEGSSWSLRRPSDVRPGNWRDIRRGLSRSPKSCFIVQKLSKMEHPLQGREENADIAENGIHKYSYVFQTSRMYAFEGYNFRHQTTRPPAAGAWHRSMRESNCMSHRSVTKIKYLSLRIEPQLLCLRTCPRRYS